MTLENIGGFSLTAVVIFVAGWLVKNWLESKIKADVEHQYKKEFAEFQSSLEKAKQAEIANVTSRLNIIEAQNNVRFSRVFEKTATVIAEVYGKLLTLKEL